MAKRIRKLKKLRIQSDYCLEVPLKDTKEYGDWLFYGTDFAIDLVNTITAQFENHFKNS